MPVGEARRLRKTLKRSGGPRGCMRGLHWLVSLTAAATPAAATAAAAAAAAAATGAAASTADAQQAVSFQVENLHVDQWTRVTNPKP